MADKKRKTRRSYLNDFRPDVTGEYRYTGKHQRYIGPLPKGKALLVLIVLTGALALGVIGAGLIPAPSMTGNGNIYVLPPFIGEMIAVFVTVWASAKLIFPAGSQKGELKLRSYAYDRSVKKLPHRTVISAVFAGLSIVANAVFLILNGFCGKAFASVAVIVLHAVVIAAALCLKAFAGSMKFEETGGEAKAFKESIEIEKDPAPLE